MLSQLRDKLWLIHGMALGISSVELIDGLDIMFRLTVAYRGVLACPGRPQVMGWGRLGVRAWCRRFTSVAHACGSKIVHGYRCHGNCKVFGAQIRGGAKDLFAGVWPRIVPAKPAILPRQDLAQTEKAFIRR